MDYETIESSLEYEGKVLKVYRDKVRLPNGATATRENIVRGSAVAMIPVDKDGNMYFVRQYRHAAKPKKPSIRAQLDAAKKEQSKQTPPREKTKELEV